MKSARKKEDSVAIDGQFIPGIAPEVMADMKAQESKRKAEDAQVLDSLDDFSLSSWGFSPPLKVTRNGEASYVRFKLKSVGLSDVMDVYQKRAPLPPGSLRVYKRDSDVARQLNMKHDITVWETNEADPGFQEMKREHEHQASMELILRGLAYDLKWQGQVVLKGADINVPTEIIDRDKALLALNRMGLTGEHFAVLVRAIRELTAEVEENENLA